MLTVTNNFSFHAFLNHYGPTLGIVALAAFVIFQFQRNEDLQEHRKPFLFCLAAMALVAIAALLLYKSSTNKSAVILAAVFLEFALAWFSLNILNRATNDFLGGLTHSTSPET